MNTATARRTHYDGLVRSIWAETRKRGISEETLRGMVLQETDGETNSTRKMRRAEKLSLLRRIRGNRPHAASERQIWAIEKIWLLRLGWNRENFRSWLTGPQSPFETRARAEAVLEVWPSSADLKAKRIRVPAYDAERIIEGLKGAWRNIAGIEDVEAEHKRVRKLWRAWQNGPEHFRAIIEQAHELSHQMKNQPTSAP